MPVNIKITDQETKQDTAQEPQGVKIEVVEKDEVEGKLKLRSALNGDLMIMDHKDIDIVLKPSEKRLSLSQKKLCLILCMEPNLACLNI